MTPCCHIQLSDKKQSEEFHQELIELSTANIHKCRTIGQILAYEGPIIQAEYMSFNIDESYVYMNWKHSDMAATSRCFRPPVWDTLLNKQNSLT